MSDDVFWAKVRQVLMHAVMGLSPEDRDARVLHCRQTGEHGITAHPEGGMIRFEWGGRTLCAIERDLLTDDCAELPRPEFVPEVPDTVPDGWTDER